MYILGIIFLVVGLLVSVALHELGHMLPAKRFGVKVPEYAVGLGPRLWSKQYGETEYSLRAIPLGGFVRLASMVYPGAPDRTTTRANGKLTLAEETRLASAEELAPEEAGRAFWRIEPWKKLIVMFSGPFTNFLIAIACTAIALMGIGVIAPTTTLGGVVECVSTNDTCTDEDPEGPAHAAGLEAGDTITSWNGQAVTTWEELTQAIVDGGAKPVEVTYVRDGQSHTTTLTPVPVERAITDENGMPSVEMRAYAGISAGYDMRRAGPKAVAKALGDMASGTAGVVLRLPQEVWRAVRSIGTGESREGGVMSVVGVADLAGDITSVDNTQYVAKARFADLLGLMATLNMALFLFNLIPLLPLDGGHILGALIEWVRKGWAKMRGAPDPGPFDTARFAGLSYVVAMAFIAMTVLLVIVDIVNPAF